MNAKKLGKNKLVIKTTSEKFWIGIIRLSDGEIIETHNYEDAQNSNFNTRVYFAEESDKLVKIGSATYFRVTDDNSGIEFDCGSIGDTAWTNLCDKIKFDY